jgi:rSAM/selenodomain-associated transferase 2/rSAM/selenodomain-associated transferase 1
LRGSRLIVFVRYPVAGRIKTRLIPALGEDGAAALSREMTEHTMNWASRLAGKGEGGVEVRFDGGSVPKMEAWLGKALRYVPQGDGDIGTRMDRAFRESFAEGIKKVVLIGTDIPELTVFHVREVWKALDEVDLILGPAHDGGYGLIGLRRPAPEIFQGPAWGTDEVLTETLAKAAAADLTARMLPAVRDVDRPEDLPLWERTARQSISVIVPAINEGNRLERTLSSIGRPADTEVIIADGGSRDETLSIARKAGAKVVSCRPGRGGQLNSGAAEAAGDILLFLHADTRLPQDYGRLVRGALKDPEVAGGSFALRFEPCPPLLKINEVTANWRARILHLPFGDQAIFVRSALFRLLGGYRDLPLMEDVEFARRLHRAGRTAFLLSPVRTSSRRYSGGYWRRNLINKVVFAGYFMGIPPDRLAKMYRHGDPTAGA